MSTKARRLSGHLVSRHLAWSAVVCTTLCAFVARPAYADPAVPSIPDAGSRPLPAGPLALPGGGTPRPATPAAAPVLGPLGQQIMAESAAVEALGEQLKQTQQDLARAHETTLTTAQAWSVATATTADLRAKAAEAAAEAYKAATALGPLGQYTDQLHRWSVLAPGLGEQPGGEAQARELARAERAEQVARQAYDAAAATEQQLTAKQATLQQQFQQRQAALVELRRRNAAELARIEAERDAYEQSLGSSINISASVAGQAANPKAIKAVEFALRQLGKPYVWGTEGPNTYDCSGLVLASYASVGVNLPRIANTQYHATTPVPVSQLLPGDLLAFGTDRSDWTSIHHIGIYLGNGRMIHAPTTGDVVKISPVWWSEFFGASRVLPAVPAPAQPTTPAPPPAASPLPSRNPSPSPTLPRPSESAPPSSSSPSGGSSTSPSPDPTTASPSPSTSPDLAATSPDPSASTTSSPDPTTSSPTTSSDPTTSTTTSSSTSTEPTGTATTTSPTGSTSTDPTASSTPSQ